MGCSFLGLPRCSPPADVVVTRTPSRAPTHPDRTSVANHIRYGRACSRVAAGRCADGGDRGAGARGARGGVSETFGTGPRGCTTRPLGAGARRGGRAGSVPATVASARALRRGPGIAPHLPAHRGERPR